MPKNAKKAKCDGRTDRPTRWLIGHVSATKREKTKKYASLVNDLAHDYLVSFFSIEVSARGQVTKENRSRLKSFFFKCCVGPNHVTKSLIRVSSKAALLSSYSLFSARREPTWEDLLPLPVK